MHSDVLPQQTAAKLGGMPLRRRSGMPPAATPFAAPADRSTV
eukprot:gene20098-biopygen13073